MKLRGNESSFHIRSEHALGRFPSGRMTDPGRGYALLVLILMVTLLLISLAAALPNVYVAGQREREEELIFRGTQYARAIALFHRQFNRYPTSVDELIETNGLHFLRHRFPDPMSHNGKWRFIHADANGVPLDSRTLTPPVPARGAGTSPAPWGLSSSDQEKKPATPSGQKSELQGGYIIGVASSSTRRSIRVWNHRTEYDEWEFLVTSLNLAAPPAQGATPGEPGKPGQGFPTVPPGLQGPLPPRPPDTMAPNP